MSINTKLAAIMLGITLAPASLYYSDGILSNAIAGSSTEEMAVSASVAAVCNFAGSANTLAFGPYDPTSTNASTGVDLDASATFQARCTKGTTGIFTIDEGDNGTASATAPVRKVKYDATNLLTYQLYTNAGRTTVWSTGTSNDFDYVATTAAPTTFTVYGRIPKGQEDVTVGAYTDSVTITVSY